MRFGLILAGMIFIFSPDISMIDFLPDVIGWLLIVAGLTPLADLELRALDAKKLALRMVFISGAKHFLSLYTFRFSITDNLLATFSVMILELITVLPFVKDLMKSLEYSSMRLSVPINADKLSLAKWYLYIFFPIKSFLMVFPSTVALFDSSATGNYNENTWFIDFSALMRVFMVFAFFLSAVLFIVMLTYFIPFWRRIIKNRELVEKYIRTRKEEVLSVESRMIKKNSSFVISFILVSMVFFFDFYVDGNDVLPTFIGFLLVFCASLFARVRMREKTLPIILFSLLGLVASALSYFYKYSHLKENGFVIDYNFSKYTYALPLSITTLVFEAIVLLLVISFIDKIGGKYTREKVSDSTLLLKAGALILSAFGFFLYTYPDLNTTFTFPSLIFGGIYIAFTINYLVKTLKQINNDNKD